MKKYCEATRQYLELEKGLQKVEIKYQVSYTQHFMIGIKFKGSMAAHTTSSLQLKLTIE